MSLCRHGHMVVSNYYYFFTVVNQSGGKWPMLAHHPLHSTQLYRLRSGAKVAHAARVDGEQRVKVCEFVDGCFKSCDVWKHSGAKENRTENNMLGLELKHT